MTQAKADEQTKGEMVAWSTPLSKTGAMVPANLQQAIEVAKMIAHSGMVPKQYQGNTGGVLIAIQMGAELGLAPLSAIQNIAVINGRPSLWGDAVLALVMSHPDCEDIVEDDHADIKKNSAATCIVKRRGRSPVKRTFSVDDAQTAGLWKKAGPWTQYPARMLQMRARGFALRDAFPDALRGIQMAEEVRDIPAAAEWVGGPTELPEGRQTASVPGEMKSDHAPTPAEKEPAKKSKPKPPPAEEPPHNPETGEVTEGPRDFCGGHKPPDKNQQEFANVGPPPMEPSEDGEEW